MHRHTVRAFLVAVAVMGALLLVGGPANAAPAVTSMDGGSTGAKATCTTLVTSPASSVPQGTEVTLTAMVTPAAATGKVQFKDGTTDLSTAVAVTNGTAELKMKFDAGAHSLTAVFTPTDPTAFKSSTSQAVPLTVTAPAPGGAAQTATTPTQATGAGQAQQSGQMQQSDQPVLKVGGVTVVEDDDDEGLIGSLVDGLL